MRGQKNARPVFSVCCSFTRAAQTAKHIPFRVDFYLVQLQMPPLRMEKPEDIETLPIQSVNPEVNLMIRDVATVRQGLRPGELDRDMSQRYLTLTAVPEDHPRRRTAQLHRKLRTLVGLSQAHRLYRKVERGHRRQGQEG